MHTAIAAAVPAVVVAGPRRGLVLVRCERFACILLATACGTRHAARWPSGKRKGAPRFPPCASCGQGSAVVAGLRLRGWTPPAASQPADVLDAVQRAARGRWLRSFPAHAEPGTIETDPWREAAALFREFETDVDFPELAARNTGDGDLARQRTDP